jgi:hypothetical protein
MTPTVLWIVGEPGVGKTTLARGLLEPDSRLIAKPKWTVGPTVCAAGHYTGATFDGGDTVAYNGAAACLDFWRERLQGHRLTILDGDRFSNGKVVAWFREHAPYAKLMCAYLDAPAGVAAARRAARGSKQNESWIAGRATKAHRFMGQFAHSVCGIFDASVPCLPSSVADFVEQG